MAIAIGIGIAVIVVVFAVWIVARRAPRQDAGMTSFRRHIDALSPEARREVMDRVRGPEDPSPDGDAPSDRTRE